MAFAASVYSVPVDTIGQNNPENKRLDYQITLETGDGIITRNTHRIAIVVGDSVDDKKLLEIGEAKRVANKRVKIIFSPAYENSEATKLYRDSTNNCVKWSAEQAGISGSLGNGGRKGINTQEPKVGDIGVQRGIIHAVYLTEINGDMITFSESNYVKNWITSRTLPRSEFLGFIEQ